MASSRKIHSKWVTFPEKELGQRRIGAGYLAVGVKESGRSRTLYVHRLVAEAFLGKPSDKNEVNHIDGNKQNNNLANLEWTTHSANLQHAFKNELHKQRSLTPEEVKSIRAGLLIGKKADDLAAIYGVTKSAISHIKYRRSWRWLD